MRDIDSVFIAHASGVNPSITSCTKITRKDTTVFGFTALDEDIVFEGVTYLKRRSYDPSDIQIAAMLNVDVGEIQGSLIDPSITEEDIRAGKWDDARVELFLVNFRDLTMGRARLRSGWLGEISQKTRDVFTAEFCDLFEAYRQNIGALTSPLCNAVLGDARCKKDLTDFTFASEVLTISADRRTITCELTNEAEYFDYGDVVFTSGDNNGLRCEVKTHLAIGDPITGAILVLQLPADLLIEVGDTFNAIAGCNKTFVLRDADGGVVPGHCIAKFNNHLNNRGFPWMAGQDKLIQVGRRA